MHWFCQAKRYTLLKFRLNRIEHMSVGIFFYVACLEKNLLFCNYCNSCKKLGMVCFAGVSCSYLKRKKISVYNVWCKSQVLFSWCYTTDWRVFWKVWRAFFKKRGVNLINIEARTFQKLWCDFAENCGAHALAKNCCAFQWKLWRAQLKIMACFVTKMGMWNVFIVY